MSLLELFCDVDDFYRRYESESRKQLVSHHGKRGPKPTMSLSEVMTIVIWFHASGYRNFKSYYQKHVCVHLRSEFPRLVSYTRFVELMPRTLLPLSYYLKSRFGSCTGISFVDSTPLPVCHNRRIKRHKVFAQQAGRGKTSMGWFYGFKLHLVVNEHGELLGIKVTAGNVDDRRPLPQFAKSLFGKLFGDKGYLSKALFRQLYEDGVQLITPIRKNMKNRLMLLFDKLMARKRAIIETINDQLKNIQQVAHTRHRSEANFAVNVIAGLIAYTHQDKKPALNLSDSERLTLPAVI